MKLKIRAAVSLLLAAAMALSLVSCSGEGGEPAGSDPGRQALDRPTEDIVYQNASSGQAQADYTGSIVKASLNDTKYGGPQFVAKLFTEGMSRAPLSEEYVEYTGIIEQKGCSVETLTELAGKLFGGAAFQKEQLTEKETLFAVYRAILSRDPTKEELSAGVTDAKTLAEKLCATEEFAQMLPDIIKGPYHWQRNNRDAYTGDKVMTSDELQALFKENKDVLLPQGTLVLVSGTISVPEGGSLQTEGNPTHYTKMARLIRTGAGDYHMIITKDNSSLKNVYVEGEMSAFEVDKVLNGSNVVVSGSHGTVTGCRITDSVSHQNLWAVDASEFGYLAHNLITGYAADHNKTWQDGISCLGADFIIEYNNVVDVTDGCIAIFRYVDAKSETPHVRAQNTIVRYNTIVNLGNSAYVAYDHETGNYHSDKVDGARNPANMTGLVAYENQIWTSMRAHVHLLVTMSTVPWLTEAYCDKTIGGSVYNNYTPDGCYVLTACGIAVDKVTQAAVRGNRFHLYLGEWCPDSQGMGARIYSVNEENVTKSDLQAGHTNREMSPANAAFIDTLQQGLLLEAADEVLLREAYIYEEKQTIPAERFVAETRE